MPKPRLLFIIHPQFGYQTDYYYYCKLLKDDFEITYLSFHQNYPEITEDGVRVIGIPGRGHVVARHVKFIFTAVAACYRNDLIFTYAFKLCSILRILCPAGNFILDFRTASIHRKKWKRVVENSLKKIESSVFRNKTVISESLGKRLNFSQFHILPLGAEILSSSDKDFTDLRLLYVGTLYNRSLHDTLTGFARFVREFAGKLKIHYTMRADYPGYELQRLKEMTKELGVTEYVSFIPKLARHELALLFDNHNVGVSYVPITPYYNCQPPTKIFEYVLAGMVCIATATDESSLIINETNGILCQDNPDSFYESLVQFCRHRTDFHSDRIRPTLMSHQWSEIITGNLKPYLLSTIS